MEGKARRRRVAKGNGHAELKMTTWSERRTRTHREDERCHKQPHHHIHVRHDRGRGLALQSLVLGAQILEPNFKAVHMGRQITEGGIVTVNRICAARRHGALPAYIWN